MTVLVQRAHVAALLTACPAVVGWGAGPDRLFVVVSDAAYAADLGAAVIEHLAVHDPRLAIVTTIVPDSDRPFLTRHGLAVINKRDTSADRKPGGASSGL